MQLLCQVTSFSVSGDLPEQEKKYLPSSSVFFGFRYFHEMWGLVKGLIPEMQHISHNHRNGKKKKGLQNKQQPPKKTTYCHPAKKSKYAEKTTTYGWVGCDQKEYSYHVLNIPFTDLSEKKFSRTGRGVVPKPVFSESTIGDRKSKEGFVLGELQLRARNGISPLTQEYAEKNQSRQKRKR